MSSAATSGERCGRRLDVAPISLRGSDRLCIKSACPMLRRSPRPPDFESENRVLMRLAEMMADTPDQELQSLIDEARTLLMSDPERHFEYCKVLPICSTPRGSRAAGSGSRSAFRMRRCGNSRG